MRYYDHFICENDEIHDKRLTYRRTSAMIRNVKTDVTAGVSIFSGMIASVISGWMFLVRHVRHDTGT